MSPLDVSPHQFKALLYQAADMIADLYTDIDQKPVYHGQSAQAVRALFAEPLPEHGQPVDQLLNRVKQDVFPNVALHYSPHFYAWVTSCASQAALLGDFLATAINVNATTWVNAASAAEMEDQLIQWVGQFIGYHPQAGGVLLSGGSTANLTGLTLARRYKAPAEVTIEGLSGQPRMTVYASTQTHFCIEKSMDALGLGKAHLRRVPVMEDFTIDIAALEAQIVADQAGGFHPICVIGNAGTVNTGAIDPLDTLAALCRQFNLWFHVDAAYGGCAAATDLVVSRFKGLAEADSVAIDLHKWLFVPFEAGCLLVQDKSLLRQAFSFIPAYQQFDEGSEARTDYSEYSFQQSRHFRALKIWMTFKAYGAEALRQAIEGNIRVMNHLAALIDESADFELCAPPSLSIVCFRYAPQTNGVQPDETYLNELNKNLVLATESDRRIFIRQSKIGDQLVLRACCTNHRREDHHVAHLLAVLRELGERLTDIHQVMMLDAG